MRAEYKGLKKYDIHRPDIPSGKFYNHLREFYSQWGPNQLLSFSQSIDRANLQSTCGYPMSNWYKSMRDLFTNCDFEAWLSAYASSVPTLVTPTLWVSFLKDEVLPLRKISDPRQINGPSAWYKIYAGTCTYDYNLNFVDDWKCGNSCHTVGIDLMSPDWDLLVTKINAYKHSYCTDASRFDSTFPAEAFDVIRHFRSDLMPVGTPRDRLKYVYGSLSNSWCLCADGYVYLVPGGNKSGSLTTTEDNCMWNSFTTSHALSEMGFDDGYHQWVYGDDSVLATDFNLEIETFIKEKKKLGLTITMECPVDDLVYMSRTNIVLPDGFNISVSSRPGKILFSLANDRRRYDVLECFSKACAIREALYGIDEYFNIANSFCAFLIRTYRAVLAPLVPKCYLSEYFLESIRRGYVIRCLNETPIQPDKNSIVRNKQSALHVMSRTPNTNSKTASSLSRRISKLESRPRRRLGASSGSFTRQKQSKAGKSAVMQEMRKRVNSVQLPGQNIDAFTRTRSPYYKTLEDPFRFNGVKIPDDSTYPTSTFSVSFKRQLSANQYAGGSGYYVGYMVNSWQPYGCMNYLSAWDGTPTGTMTWTSDPAGGTPIVSDGGPVHNWDEISQLYREGRIVSAGMTVMPAMSSLSDKGVEYAVNIPVMERDYTAKTDADFNTLSGIQNAFTSIQCPVRDGGACVCYRPCDPRSFTYTDWQNPTTGEPNLYYGGAIFIADGVENAATFEVTIVLNFEAIPNNSSFSLVSPSPSPRDTMEMDHALNAIQAKPAVESGAAATKKALDTATSGVVHNNAKAAPKKSFGDKLLGFLGSAAKKVLPVALEALPMLLA